MEFAGFLAVFLLAIFAVSNGCLLGFGGTNGGGGGGGGGRGLMLPSSQSFARFRLRREFSENVATSGAKPAQSEPRRSPDVITLDSPVTSDVIRRLIATATDYVRSALKKASNPWPIQIIYDGDEDDGTEDSRNAQQTNTNATLHISHQNIALTIRDQENPRAVSFVGGFIVASLKSDLVIAISRDIIKVFNKGVTESIQLFDQTATEGQTCAAKSSQMESLICCFENDKILTVDSKSSSGKNTMSRLHVTTNSITIDVDSDLTLSFTTDSIDLHSGNDSYLSLSSDSLDLYFDDVNTTLSLSDDGIDLSLDEQNGVFSLYDNYTLAMSFDDQNVSVSFNENIDFSVRDKNFTVGMFADRYKLLHQLTVPDLKITLTSELGKFALDSDSSTFKEKRSPDPQSIKLLILSWGMMMLHISDQLITVINPLIFGYGNQQLLLVIE